MAKHYGILSVWTNKKNGQIIVVGELGKTQYKPLNSFDSSHMTLRVADNVLKLFQPNGKAFCTYIPDDLQDQDGLLVEFDYEPNLLEQRNPNTDYQLVTKGSIRPIGSQIIDLAEKKWRSIPPFVAADSLPIPLPSKQGLLLRTQIDGAPAIVGPWKPAANGWEPKNPSLLFAVPEDKFTGDFHVQDYGHFTLDQLKNGRHIDASDKDALIEWWRKQVIRLGEPYRSIINQLDSKGRGWRAELSNSLSELDSSMAKDRDHQCLEKILSLFDLLDWRDNEWRHILESDAGQIALRSVMETRVANLEKMATDEVEARIREKRADLEAVTEELEEKRRQGVETDLKIAALDEAAAHLSRERKRLALDVAALGGLLSDPDRNAWAVAPPSATAISSPTWSPPSRSISLAPGIDETRYVTTRLLPALSCYEPSASESDASAFHAALLYCRAVRVPHAGWSRAYAAALGMTAPLFFLTASPDWRTFADAWKGGLRRPWLAAAEHPEFLFLVHVRELALAFPDAWIHPLLDCLAGYSYTIPVEGDPIWPDNLRLCWSDRGQAEKDRFAISDHILDHFPSIKPSGDFRVYTPLPPEFPDSCSMDAWRRWRRSEAVDWKEAADYYAEHYQVTEDQDYPVVGENRAMIIRDAAWIAAHLARMQGDSGREWLGRAFALRNHRSGKPENGGEV